MNNLIRIANNGEIRIMGNDHYLPPVTGFP